jgi:hypothetical protein
MAKPTKVEEKQQQESVSSGSEKIFWNDQVFKGLERFPTKAMPNTPKLGQNLFDPTDPGFEKFGMEVDTVPAILEINYVPIIGTAPQDTDPSNLDGVFSNILATLRQKVTNAYNYDQGTIAATLMSIGMVPVLLAHVKRRMKALFTKNTLGSNISADDLWRPFSDGYSSTHGKPEASRDMDGKIKVYNDIVDVYNSIAPPNFFPIFRRWEEMESRVFRDLEEDPNECAQYFYFSTTGYYWPRLNDDPTNPGFVLEWRSFYGELETELSRIYDLVKAVQNDQDMTQVLGDICKTYGETRYTIPLLTEAELAEGIKSEYDYLVNLGLYHATVLPVTAPVITIDAKTGKATGKLNFKADIIANTSRFQQWKALLSLPKLYNSQKFGEDLETMTASTTWTIVDNTYTFMNGAITKVGTEVLNGLRIWGYKYEAGARSLQFWERDNNCYIAKSVGVPFDDDTTILNIPASRFKGLMKTFAYGPTLAQYGMVLNSAQDFVESITMIDPDMEFEYPVFLPAQVLKQWHSALRYRLWGMPHNIQFMPDKDAKASALWT